MNNKGQDALEMLFCIGGAILFIAIIIALATETSDAETKNNAAENFCEAWAEEKAVIHFEGSYPLVLSAGQSKIRCEYYEDIGEVFDGGISKGPLKNIYFEISEDDLLEWGNKGEPNPCCEECC